MTRIHSSLDLKGLLTWSDRDLSKMVRSLVFDGTRAQDVADLRSKLATLVADGIWKIPMGEACEGFDPKTGCPGHERTIS